MKFLKRFSRHSDYEAFTATTSFVKPNISTCKQEKDVHYSPIAPCTLFRRVITVDSLTREVVCDSQGKLATIFDGGIEYIYRESGEVYWVFAFRETATQQVISACGGETRVEFSYNEIDDAYKVTLNGYSVVFGNEPMELIEGEIREWTN